MGGVLEEDNEQGKQLIGLGQYQVRKWTPWHRHVTCTILALAFLTVQRVRHQEPEAAGGPTSQDTTDESGKAEPTSEKNSSP